MNLCTKFELLHDKIIKICFVFRKLNDGSLSGDDASFAKQAISNIGDARDALASKYRAHRDAVATSGEGRKPFPSAAACIQSDTDTDKLEDLGFSPKLVGVLSGVVRRYCTEDPSRDKYRTLTSAVQYAASLPAADQEAVDNAISGLNKELETKLAAGTLNQNDADFAKNFIGRINALRDALKSHLANRDQSGNHSAGPGQDAFMASVCNRYSGRHLRLPSLGFNTDHADVITKIVSDYCGKDSPTYLQFPLIQQTNSKTKHFQNNRTNYKARRMRIPVENFLFYQNR
jgi:hypothetical protein